MDHLGLPVAHVPETHVFQVSANHDSLRPRKVNIVNTGRALGRGGRCGGDIPGANRTVITGRNKTLTIVIEADGGDQVGMANILLNACGCLRSEKLNLILVDTGCGYMLIIQRGSDIKHGLVQSSEGLEWPTRSRVPGFDKTIATTSVENVSIAVESQTSGLSLMCTGSPSDATWHSCLLIAGPQVLWLNDLSQLRLFSAHIALYTLPCL